MSLGIDFLELIDLLWEIEELDMWIPQQHGSLAYLLDRLYGTEQYAEKYERMRSLAKEKNANEFAFYASRSILEVADNDATLPPSDRAMLQAIFERQKKNYEDQNLSVFGMVKECYVPDWFFEIFSGYIELEEIKRETLILQYCKAEQMSQEQANEVYRKLSTQFDLLNEFYFYVKNRRFKSYFPRTVEGLSAKHLYETICDTPLDAYLFLVYLREEPQKALAEYQKRLLDSNK